MHEMTTHERIKRIFEHREADRIPILEGHWDSTLVRWKKEGMPEGVDYREYFGIDRIEWIKLDNSPGYEEKIIEEDDEHVVFTTKWGATQKKFKKTDSTPEFLDFKKSGGYIFASDHSVPSSVSLKEFKHMIGMVKTLGQY